MWNLKNTINVNKTKRLQIKEQYSSNQQGEKSKEQQCRDGGWGVGGAFIQSYETMCVETFENCKLL